MLTDLSNIIFKLNVFAKFRCWKAFSVWHMNVRDKRIKSARKSLEKNLFFLNMVKESLKKSINLVKIKFYSVLKSH